VNKKKKESLERAPSRLGMLWREGVQERRSPQMLMVMEDTSVKKGGKKKGCLKYPGRGEKGKGVGGGKVPASHFREK